MSAIKLFIKRPPGANGENKSLFTLKLIQLVPSLSFLPSPSFRVALATLQRGAADEHICQRRLLNERKP